MTSTRPSLRRRALVLVAALGLLAAACGSDDDSSSDDAATATDAPSGTTTGTEAASDGETVEIDWWHIQNNDPGMADWQNMADAYMAENPEREDQHHRDGERSVQGRAADQPAGR